MVRLILALLLCLTSVTEGAGYGGWGGSPHTVMCQENNYVRSIAIKSGLEIDAIAILCTNEGWSWWYGGNGGSLHVFHATSSGFCGMWGKSGALVDRMCFQEANGNSICYGGNGGGSFTDRHCSDAPGNNRMRLKGFHLRSGLRVDRIEPIWELPEDCPNFITIGQAPNPTWDGQYEFDSWKNGHQMYRKVDGSYNGHNKCIYYGNYAWRFYSCSEIDANPYHYFYSILNWDGYDTCVSNLGGNPNWKSADFIYPPLQVIGDSGLSFTWGNTVGYWRWKQQGQGYGDSASYSTTRHYETTTSTTLTEEQEASFASTDSLSSTNSFEVGVSASFYGLGASAKYDHSQTELQSTTDTVRANTITALTDATNSGTSTTTVCTTTMPSEPYNTWVWNVYRASSIEDVGASQETCSWNHQTGACKSVPPNCPVGTCQDLQCIYCSPGTNPLKPIADIRAAYPACFVQIFGEENIQCHPEMGDWDCCSPQNPCPAGEGDCDSDSDCLGNAVCIQNPDPYSPDICTYPGSSGRRLLDIAHEDHEILDEEYVFTSPEYIAPSGCGQFDDEGHCVTGPLFKFCKWDEVEKSCVLKDDVDESAMPQDDFTWIYDL